MVGRLDGVGTEAVTTVAGAGAAGCSIAGVTGGVTGGVGCSAVLAFVERVRGLSVDLPPPWALVAGSLAWAGWAAMPVPGR